MSLQRKTAGIFETEHFESVYAHIRYLDAAQYKLILFVTEPVYHALGSLLQTDAHRMQWVVKPAGMPMWRFILRVATVIQQKKIATFFLHTVSSNYLVWGSVIPFLRSTRFFLTVHDAHSMFASRPGLPWRKWVNHIGKKLLLQAVTAYLTLSENTLACLSALPHPAKPVYWLPGALYEQPDDTTIRGGFPSTLHVAVPGTIDPRRRDYEQVMELVRRAAERRLPVDFFLCGGIHPEQTPELYAALSRCRQAYPTLHWENSRFMDTSRFDHLLNKAHFIWIPSTIRFKDTTGEWETYGHSKTSGGVNDAIRFAKPLVVPDGFQVEPNQQPAAFVYKTTDDLLHWLEQQCASPVQYGQWKKNAVRYSLRYTLDAVTGRIHDWLE